MEHFYEKINGWFDFPKLYRHAVETSLNDAHFVEVGSWLGKSSSFLAVEICNSGKNIKLDCIDTWKGSDEESHKKTTEIINNTLYESFLLNIHPVKHIINPIRNTSKQASYLYKDNSLDFVFLDASHDYESVKEDLNAWYPKLKPGCYFSGHDFCKITWPGVVKAVNEFATINQINTIQQSDISCWCFIKPNTI